MRKTTLWSSLGAAVLLAASSFSASAATYKVNFLSPSPDATEVTSEEMKKIVFQYESNFTAGQISTLQNFGTNFATGVTLEDAAGNTYPLMGYAMVKKDGTYVAGNDDPASQDLLTSTDVNQIAVTFGDLNPGTYTVKIAEKIVNTGSYPFNVALNDGSGEHTWTITGGGNVDPVNPLEAYELIPASGERIPYPNGWMPYSFKVSFPEIGENTLEAIDENAFENITLSDGVNTYPAYFGNLIDNGKAFNFQFYSGIYGCPEIPVGKEYTLVVPEGFCKTASGALSPEIRGTYTLAAPLPEFENQDPAYNAENPSITEMRLNFSAAVEFKADAAPMAVLNYDADADTGMTATFSALENDGKTVVVKFSDVALEDGEYYFNVPDGAIYAAGDPEAALEGTLYTFIIKAVSMPEYAGQYPAEDEGVADLTEVKQFFSAPVAIAEGAATEVTLFNQTAYENGDSNGEAGTATISLSEDGLTAIFTLNPTEPLTPADYKIIVKKGTFVAASDASYQLGNLILKFKVAAAPVNPMTLFTVDPEDNTKVTEISKVVIDFYELNPSDGAEPNGSCLEKIIFKNVTTGQTWNVVNNSTNNNYAMRTIMPVDENLTGVTLTEPGEYTLTIPAEAMFDYSTRNDAVRTYNEEIVLHYTIPEPAPNPFEAYTITPDGSTDVSNIGNIDLVFNNIMFGTEVQMNTEKKVTLLNKTTGTEYIPQSVGFFEIPGVFTDWSNVKIKFDPAVTELGEYTFTIEAGLCSLDGAESPEIVREFTIAEIPNVFRDWTVTPGNGEEVKSIDKVVLNFPHATEGVGMSVGDITLTLKDSETVIYPTSCELAYDQVEGEDIIGMYEITFEPAVTEAGTYVLNIPADKFLDFTNPSEQCSPEISVEIIVAENPFGNYVLTPASMEEGLKEVSTVEVLFPAISADQTVTFDEADVEKIGMRNVDNDQVISAIAIEQADTENGKLLTIRFAKAATDAKHILTIPAGILKLGENANFEIKAIYDIEAAGVALLVGENGTADVYDVSGRVILLNADAEALRQLEDGLYIINGKKVVIRK